METYISDFHTNFYIPDIQTLAFHLPHVRILGTNQFGNTRCEALKRLRANQDVLCCHDYSEMVVPGFTHLMQSGYHGRKISVSIEVITLD